eukprot:gene20096-22066_t
MDKFDRLIILSLFIAFFIHFADKERASTKQRRQEEFKKVVAWLEYNAPGAEKTKQIFFDEGIIELGHLSLVGVDKFLYLCGKNCLHHSSNNLAESLHKLKKELIFKYWLSKIGLHDLHALLANAGYDSLEKVSTDINYEQASVLMYDYKSKLQPFWQAVKKLKETQHLGFDDYPVGVEVSWFDIFWRYSWRLLVITANLYLIAVGLSVIIICVLGFLVFRWISRALDRLSDRYHSSGSFAGWVQRVVQTNRRTPHQSPTSQPALRLPRIPPPSPHNANMFQWGSVGRFFTNLFGQRNAADAGLPFNPSQTKVKLFWDTHSGIVGEMRQFSVTFYKNVFFVCPINSVNDMEVKITVGSAEVPCSIENDDTNNSFLVKFTPHISGSYKIFVYACGRHVRTDFATMLPGPIDPSKTSLKVAMSTIIAIQNEATVIPLDERDKYGNTCRSSEESLAKYCFEIHEIVDEMLPRNPDIRIIQQASEEFAVSLMFSYRGCYEITVTYDQRPIMKNIFTALVLYRQELEKVNSDVKKQSWNLWYEVYLLPNEEPNNDHKAKKVYCYITSKVLTIKDFYLKIFPRKLQSIRMRPTTKLTLLPLRHKGSGHFVMRIEDNAGQPVVLACKDRRLLAATFTQMLLGKIGGHDTFENKRKYLYSELNKAYLTKSTSTATISVKRESLLHDSMKATKHFSDSDWGKKFSIVFVGEPGLDYGGLKREWFQLNCDTLFNCKNKIFHKLGKDDPQSLIHPNPFRPEEFKTLKYYEFAGKMIGKILIDCALNNGQCVRARFSRSFLSQILGFGVSWKHFETDDKDFFKTKVNYILKNDVEDLELTFTEDVYDDNQVFVKTVDLKPNGSQIPVTNENKMKYLQHVAEYRLVNRVKDEIAAFLKGLNSLVPDKLLSLFDENELELLICGTDNISVTDLQNNFVKCGGGGTSFEKVLVWFWEILETFNQEELSRLIQFTTGCSQLPPGGFKDLFPKFQISAFPGLDALPSAHTCFNMLCLPNYSSKDEFQKLLIIGLNEGSEGFGLA